MIHSLTGRVTQNRKISADGMLMSIEIPIVLEFRAGQFVHVRVDESSTTPLLRRPFSVWDRRSKEVDILYAIRGAGTQRLAGKTKGDPVGFLGPLGNSFVEDPTALHYLFVAGGVGIVPFYLFSKQILARRPKAAITLLFGARTRDMLHGLEELRKLPIDVRPATDDGSIGHHGLVTDLARDFLKQGVQIFGCGPDPMLHALVRLAKAENVPCQLSLETRMGCALGACRACVTPVVADGGWRYSRVCCEGPNYDARELYWQ